VVASLETDIRAPSDPPGAQRGRNVEPEPSVPGEDEAVRHHGVLDPGTHFIPRPLTLAALLKKLPEARDAPQALHG